MAVVTRSGALRYDPARVGDLRRVIAPPYDVISPRAAGGALRRAAPTTSSG